MTTTKREFATRNEARIGWALCGALILVLAAAPAEARQGSQEAAPPASLSGVPEAKPMPSQPSAPAPAPAPAPPSGGSKPNWQPGSSSPRTDSDPRWSGEPRPGGREPRGGTPPPSTTPSPGHNPNWDHGRPPGDPNRHRPQGHHGHYYGRHYRWNPYWYPSYGLWWGFYGYPYYWGSYPYGGSYTTVYPTSLTGMGAIDCDVNPENAQLFVNGQYIGICDDFDGFPEYLWLEKGTYDVVVFHPGFQSIARQISMYPGLVIDIDERMVPGEAVRPEDLVSKSTERRDARVQADREREAEVEARAAEPVTEPETSEEAWGSAIAPGTYDARRDPGRLRLQVRPADASIYLDGRFIGTGDEISRLRSGLIVDAGEHRLEVVRPNYQSEEERFDVDSGEEVTLRIELDRD